MLGLRRAELTVELFTKRVEVIFISMTVCVYWVETCAECSYILRETKNFSLKTSKQTLQRWWLRISLVLSTGWSDRQWGESG